ncbi:hydroxyethylthiazole kinase [Mechercharimyces sp. CAU 1602]|uniref:hydroxyethylthiazole kinase n=1 Tax=Mechercharimyces sp. CAU 1602 TaxID=2973933 RepID=UPI0021635BDA|nr:hydroxyethylthiazole kinase [Mechercharimyces sp. CAU 1602]MCS1350532.1 hydroxyethylthiazole kinase [Mechercharimyces sp. CAU 1602]
MRITSNDFTLIDRIRDDVPLIHHITNLVSIQDSANVTLHMGASPVMAHAKEEVEEMVAASAALVLNIGTLTQEQVEAMILAGKKANALGTPVIFDPVGVGATTFRTEMARRILAEVEIEIIKGNAGEIATLAGERAEMRGVDTGHVTADVEEVAISLADGWKTVIVTGATDIVTDGRRVAHVHNGHPLMGALTGTGCMAASVIASCAAVERDYWLAATVGLATYGIAGERGAQQAATPAHFKVHFFDALATVSAENVNKSARIEVDQV